MKNSISKSNIKKFNKHFNSHPSFKIARNSLTRTEINKIAMDWDSFRLIDHTYSDIISNKSKPIEFSRLPFNHPLYIMYSSGTTGPPKSIVHGAGGTLIQHLKEHQLQCDI